MDPKSSRDKDIEIDLESGLPLIGDDSQKLTSTPGTAANQEKTLFSTISGGFVRGDHKPGLQCNEPNHNEVSVDVMRVTNASMTPQNTLSRAEGTPVKEKRKKASGKKKAPKPPRPPQAPKLDAADYKLIREISELAMLKRARIERMKALKKMRAAKSSSSGSSILAMVFTVVFCIVIIFQGMSPGKSPVSSFQGSPVSAGGAEGGLISVQYQLNPSASESSAPGSESHKSFLQLVAGSDLHEKLRRNSG